ncbi:hypothetical protein [Sphingomonas hankookensis]|uniref:hypothetical protein n=1 Tax=Sphingomonas hankookensis TaxID=563996 RepID=UPI003D30292B
MTLRDHALIAGAAVIALAVPPWLLREPARRAPAPAAPAALAAPGATATTRHLRPRAVRPACRRRTAGRRAATPRHRRAARPRRRGPGARGGGDAHPFPGDSIDGWQLRSLAIDAAYFTRGGQNARVPMPGSA